MKEKFKDVAFKRKTLKLIKHIDDIQKEQNKLEHGQRHLGIRQLFYRLVSAGYVENSTAGYGAVMEAARNGRLAGLIDWDFIVDHTRSLSISETNSKNLETYLRDVVSQYQINLWEGQPCYVEVWAEKDSVVPVLESLKINFQVPYLITRGFVSETEIYNAVARIPTDRHFIILYIGDYDPSGLAMVEDLQRRFEQYVDIMSFEIRVVAITEKQIEDYKLVPSELSVKDSRSTKFKYEYGDRQYELEAIQPHLLYRFLVEEVRRLLDVPLWEKKVGEQAELRKTLATRLRLLV